jgi:hypothetical protein
MAMNASDMADAIYTKMEAEYWPTQPLSSDAEAETKRYYRVICDAIITYVTENTDVLPGTFNIPFYGNVEGTGKVT